MKVDHDWIWQEGKYLDFWSIPHIIIGALLVWIFWFIGLNIYWNFIGSFFLILGWEFFELYVLDVHEHFPNKVFDVLTGVIGFFIMYYFIQKQGLMNLLGWQVSLSVIYFSLCSWGLWHHFNSKKVKKLK
jgi:hypothetical protein